MWLLLYYRERGNQDIVVIIREARRGRQEVKRQDARQEARQETWQGARQEVRGAGGVAQLNEARQGSLNLGAAVPSFT